MDGFNCARFPVPAKEDRNLAPIGSLNNWKGNNLALFQNSANQFVLLAQKLRNRFDGPETVMNFSYFVTLFSLTW